MWAGEHVLKDQELLESEKGLRRRFNVELFIVHPTLDPAEITAALGLQARLEWRAGQLRNTPKGDHLSGYYRDTRWRHSVRHDVNEQWFADRVSNLVDHLAAHKAFLANLKSTGGTACVIVQFIGDGYFGDQVPSQTLAKLVELGLDLGIESFPQASQD